MLGALTLHPVLRLKLAIENLTAQYSRHGEAEVAAAVDECWEARLLNVGQMLLLTDAYMRRRCHRESWAPAWAALKDWRSVSAATE